MATEAKKTVLVTGGAGFIGSNLCEALLKEGYKVIAVDNMQTGERTNVKELLQNKDFLFIKADVNNYQEMMPVFTQYNIDYIYHYAACVGVQRTLARPMEVLKDIDGIKNVLELSRLTGVKRVLFSSSSEVYGESPSFPQEEAITPLNSRLPYAVVKNIGEAFFRTYEKEFGLQYTIFRFFNTYGPRQSKDFVMSKFIEQALAGKDITVYGDGMQTRTFLFIEDHLRATINAIKSERAVNETINVGGAKEFPILDIAKKIIKLTGTTAKIKYLDPLDEGDMPRRVPSLQKTEDILGTKETVSLDEGIAKTIAYIRQQK